MTVDLTALIAANAKLQADTRAALTTKGYAAQATKVLQAMNPAPTPPPTVTRWWPDTAWPNLVPDLTKPDPNSAQLVKDLVAACPGGIFPDGVMSEGSNSIPVYHADASTPTAVVQTAYQGAVTIPYLPSFVPAGPPNDGSDHHLAVLRTDTGQIFEFQAFQVNANGGLFAHSYAVWNVRTSSLVPTATNGISVLPTVGGLITQAEAQAWHDHGTVPPHGVRIATPNTAPKNDPKYPPRWPAYSSDGGTPGGFPAGAWAALPPSVDLSTLDSCQTMVARMGMANGFWNGDSNTGGAASMFFESVSDGSAYPFTLTSLPAYILAQAVVLAP